MMLSDGGFVGMYFVLGALAVAQVLAARWALKSLTTNRYLPIVMGLAIALHPWWAAGATLRFISAQVAILSVVVWLGAVLRFVESGKWQWAFATLVAPTLGLLTYPGPALALVGGALLVLLVVQGPRSRRIIAVGLAVAAVGAVSVWSAFIAPKLSPTGYEAQLTSTRPDITDSVSRIFRTIGDYSPAMMVMAGLILAVVATLVQRGQLVAREGFILALAILAAPLAALAYAATQLHLGDPERVGLPTGVALWLIGCFLLTSLARDRVAARAAAVVTLGLTFFGAMVTYVTWTGYAHDQQELLIAVQDVREDADPNAILIVKDYTGHYGDVYVLLPPHLNIALDVEFGAGADAELCTADGVERDHPTAATYPISTTPYCSELIAGRITAPLADTTTSEGKIEILVIAPPEG